MSFNGLSPEVAERLTLLAEECAEVIHAVMKIQRHGLLSERFADGHTNLDNLQREMGDVRAAMLLLGAAGDTSKEQVHVYATQKLLAWRNDPGYLLHHQPRALLFDCAAAEFRKSIV